MFPVQCSAQWGHSKDVGLIMYHKMSFMLTFLFCLEMSQSPAVKCTAFSKFHLSDILYLLDLNLFCGLFSWKRRGTKSVYFMLCSGTKRTAVKPLRVPLHFYQAAGKQHWNFFYVEATAVFIHGQTVAYTMPPALCVFCSSTNSAWAALIL